jgi:CheY-like chemotaxis protein
MVVEGTEVQRETLTELLRREGYDAVGAADGHDALRNATST